MIIEKIFDIETGEETIIEREETPEEIKKRLKLEQEIAELNKAENARIDARNALLEKLGITEEEAKLLLG